MKFSLPGQLKGPECRRVITEAVALRQSLEPWFESQPSDQVKKLTVVLRVNGSLGSFGPAGVENIELAEGDLSCDLVVADPGWDGLGEGQIRELLGLRVLEAIDACFLAQKVAYHKDELAKLLGSLA
jgi:hypothetical protein